MPFRTFNFDIFLVMNLLVSLIKENKIFYKTFFQLSFKHERDLLLLAANHKSN